MRVYSQGMEQQWIGEYFGLLKGSFLSLGENDGQTLSNVRQLAIDGWKGVCVEASPTIFPALQALYEDSDKVQCIHTAVGTHDGVITFYESGTHLGKGDLSLLSTTKYDETLRWKGTEFTAKQVQCATVKTLLEHAHLKTFDLISIDCEGMDMAILEQMNLDNLRCSLLVIEHNGKDREVYREIAGSFGMRLLHQNAENLLLARMR